VPTLNRLVDGPCDVVMVVSQPDRPRGRGRTEQPSPVAARALELGLPLLRPERVAAPEITAALRDAAPDLGVVIAFGQFLPRQIRELPSRGFLINAHASLLPHYRGAAPIVHAILSGDTTTGVSVMRIDREMDAGPVMLTRSLSIEADETAGSLTQRMATLSADAVAQATQQIALGQAIEWTLQDPAHVSWAPKITTSDSWIDWSEPARNIANRVRAMAPTPGARTSHAKEVLRILAAEIDRTTPDRPPGVTQSSGDSLRIATGEGWLIPSRLQRAGGKLLDAAAYLRGRPIPDGEQLGDSGA
jgi:methionyl-tRNA formyltransferase